VADNHTRQKMQVVLLSGMETLFGFYDSDCVLW